MRLLSIMLLCIGLLQPQPAPAAQQPPSEEKAVMLRISAQPLADALAEFAQQTGLQMIVSSALARNRQAPPLSGVYTPEQALKQLLANSGLDYKFINPRTVTIRELPVPPDRQSRESGQIPPARLELTLVDVTPHGAAAATNESVSAAPSSVQADEPSSGDSQEAGIPELLVKGRRSLNVDIRRTADDIQPYVVLDRQTIERSLAGNLEELLMSRLPMNAASGFNLQDPGNARGNQSSIDLRGLGPDQTLILVNGRRMPGVSRGTDFYQPDINGIPLSAVERIEILPSTAGGIYGGGATGGVINIVLRNDYRGLELDARYENTFSSDAARHRLTAQAGFELEGGKTSIMLSAAHADSNMLSVGDRDFLVRARELQLFNNRASFYGSTTTPPPGATANIISANGQPLVLKAGMQSLNSLITHVPYGYAGPQSDNGTALVANADRYNLDLPAGPQGRSGALMGSPSMRSASITARRSFGERIEAFADSSWYENESYSVYGRFPTTTVRVIPSTAPNNPFVQDIRVSFAAPDFDHGSEMSSISRTVRAGGGLTARLGREWTAQAGYDWSRSRYNYWASSAVLTNAGATAMTNGTLDILRDVEAFPLDYSAYLFEPTPNVTLLWPYETELTDAALRAAGPLMTLPGGSLVLSTLLERREHDLSAVVLQSYSAAGVPSYRYSPGRGQRTDSAYVEFTAPLIARLNARPWVRGFDLQLSYRYDEISTRAVEDYFESLLTLPTADSPLPDIEYVTNRVRANQYTVGFRYRPTDSVALRLSQGASILPPSLSQLSVATLNNLPVAGALDPKRGNQPVGAVEEYLLLGNNDLKSEKARSLSAGLIFTPARLPGLRLSVDYTRIRKTDEIDTISAQAQLDLEDMLPGRIRRAPLTPEDQALGYTGGVIEFFHAGLINMAHTELEAYDISGDFRWPTRYGTIQTHLMASHTPHRVRQILADSPRVDSVGYSGGVLKWRGNAGLSLERQLWSAGWSMQYYHSYLVYSATASATTAQTAVLNQGSDTIPHQLYHDLFFKLHLPADSELMIGIANVLDRSPPILATSSIQGRGYSTYGDPRLRRFSVTFRKSFGSR